MRDHTPGPWFLELYEDQAFIDAEHEIELMWIEKNNNVSEEEFKENMNLVTAAPELLEALEEAYSALDYVLNSDDIMFNMSEFKYENEGLEEYFKNVIKKAKGEC